MKLEVGMYVRTDKGCISRIIDFKPITKYTKYNTLYFENVIGECLYTNEELKELKSSHNIIELIKPKDIILGNDGKLYQCWKVYKDYVFTYSKNKQGLTITLVDFQIDRVMCYEQFESMSYKVGE